MLTASGHDRLRLALFYCFLVTAKCLHADSFLIAAEGVV
jgi:hypothetical protein